MPIRVSRLSGDECVEVEIWHPVSRLSAGESGRQHTGGVRALKQAEWGPGHCGSSTTVKHFYLAQVFKLDPSQLMDLIGDFSEQVGYVVYFFIFF